MVPLYWHWWMVCGDILHGMWCFNCAAQLHAPSDAHLATATNMLEARLQKVAREEGPGWLQFREQTVKGECHGVQLVPARWRWADVCNIPPISGRRGTCTNSCVA